MDAGLAPEPRTSRFDALHAEAKASLGYAGNTLRSVTERYREVYREALVQWTSYRDQLEKTERRLAERLGEAERTTGPAGGPTSSPSKAPGKPVPADLAEAEMEADDERLRLLRVELSARMDEVAFHQAELARLELATRTIERIWLFLERGDQSLVADVSEPTLAADLHLRIVEAQEAERTRLAQEVHDGPAQALSNAIFQIEYIDRILDQDAGLAHTELRFLRDLMRRELGDVRTFISQLRPPVPDPLGLDDSIREVVGNLAPLLRAAIVADLQAPGDRIPEAARTVVVRVVQEALQNVRKHAEATRVRVVTRIEDDAWTLEVRDDGRGFDVEAVAARGRRNFGLQFMRERAGLIGAHFEVRSRAGGGTVVRLAIPIAKEKV